MIEIIKDTTIEWKLNNQDIKNAIVVCIIYITIANIKWTIKERHETNNNVVTLNKIVNIKNSITHDND